MNTSPAYEWVAANDEESYWDTLELSSSSPGPFEIGEADDDDDDESKDAIFRVEPGIHGPQQALTGDHPRIPPPSNYFCPLTLHIMENPVVDGCGHCFDHDAIVSWLRFHRHCPISRKPLDLESLFPAEALKRRIDTWKVEHAPLGVEPDWKLSEDDLHSHFELILLPQERRVLSLIKLRKQVKTQRGRFRQCIWSSVGVIVFSLILTAVVAIYMFDVDIQGPL